MTEVEVGTLDVFEEINRKFFEDKIKRSKLLSLQPNNST